MKRNGRKYWLILVPILLILCGVCWFFRDAIIMYVAPKSVLSSAIQTAITELDARMDGGPYEILLKAYDPDGKQTIDLDLSTANDLLGPIRYDVQLQTDIENNRLTAAGTVKNNGKSLDVSAYFDGDFAALTSEGLVKGGYYGITYDSFSEDIRGIPLISLFIPSDTIREWESSVSKLDTFMSRSYSLPQIPEISEEDIKLAVLGVLTLPGDVTKETVLVHEAQLPCYKLTYSAGGTKVKEILKYFLSTPADENSKITTAFYLYEKVLVKAELVCAAGEEQVSYIVTLGMDASADDLTLSQTHNKMGEISGFSLAVSTLQKDSLRQETICFNDTVISYNWNPESGAMTLTLPGKEAVDLTLTDREEGVEIATKDLGKLLSSDNEVSYDCVMTIKRGSDISVPEYKKLSSWSLEDLLILLSGVGGWFGITV